VSLTATQVHAAEKLTFLSSWKAQAEHGGYYEALAKGYYSACGVDLTIRQGGPAIDGKQLFVAGAVDLMMASFSDTAFQVNAAGFPAKAIMAAFQKTPQILMTHDGNGINKLEDMRGKPIMVSASARTTYWPFLRARYGFTDSQLRAYTGQLAPWLMDPTGVQQGMLTNEPQRVEQETGKAPKTFLLADYGYGAYGSVVLASQKMIDEKPAVLQCFVSASAHGWSDFFKDPKPAIELIKKNNPDNPDAVIDYGIKMMKSAGIVESPDTAKGGIGIMTDERWKSHFELLANAGVIPKTLDYRQMYTLQFLTKPAAK
jgi:NitT/TauT family transport system substrate-binding protein